MCLARQVRGLFYAVGHTPATGFLEGRLEADDCGYIVTRPGTTITSVPGVFAAGDVQDRKFRQAVTACASGRVTLWLSEGLAGCAQARASRIHSLMSSSSTAAVHADDLSTCLGSSTVRGSAGPCSAQHSSTSHASPTTTNTASAWPAAWPEACTLIEAWLHAWACLLAKHLQLRPMPRLYPVSRLHGGHGCRRVDPAPGLQL